MSLNDSDGMADSVDPDQTAPSDQSLHCLPRPVCLKTGLFWCWPSKYAYKSLKG